MPDVFTKKKRSEVMASIRGRGNRTTELAVADLFRRHRISGWRRHWRVPGRPDFAFPREQVAVFVDGCFWHRCPTCSTAPATNREFWQAKLDINVARDRSVTRTLRRSGWRVVRIWEHRLRRPSDRVRIVTQLVRLLSGPVDKQ